MTRTNPAEQAASLLADDMARFNAEILAALVPQKPYLTEVEYAIYMRGKRLRPLLLMMVARLAGDLPLSEPLPVRVVKAATSLEMLHVATLIHDDIIDKAPLRRGALSVNAARGADVALLIGDMQFVNAVRCFASAIETQQDMFLVQMVLDVGFKICCGELDEIMTDPTWSTQRLRDRYIRTIDRKTAVLFELACESAASLMRARKRTVWKLGRYGLLLGRAFQMMDDLQDFMCADDELGKRRGTDLLQRRPTLPIIYAMEELGPDHRVSRVMHGEPISERDLPRLIDEVMYSDGFSRAYAEARRTAISAASCLDTFPECELRTLLRELAYHVVNRDLAEIDSLAGIPATPPVAGVTPNSTE